MNISKFEQRVLHALAQGGAIRYVRADNGRVTHVDCVTREGYTLTDCDLGVFRKLKQKRLIKSVSANPYRITRLGLKTVRAQLNQR